MAWRDSPTSELRKDPVVKRWVIIAPERAHRPDTQRLEVVPATPPICPFCEGNEAETPSEVFAYRAPGSRPDRPGWRVRVVPNKYPALSARTGALDEAQAFYERAEGFGVHEVIVECPQHEVSMAQLPWQTLRDVISVYRDRLIALKCNPRLSYGMIFKNVGAAAGATLEHSHSQLIATPLVPVAVQEEITGSMERFNESGRCVYCELIDLERQDGRRVVLETAHLIALAPYASRFPFEVSVLPRRHGSHFEDMARAEADDLAATLQALLQRLNIALGGPAYNYVLHTAPLHAPALAHYHWHLEVLPRVTRVAGFEWGSGFYINPVPPEEAAARLRDAKPLTASSITERLS